MGNKAQVTLIPAHQCPAHRSSDAYHVIVTSGRLAFPAGGLLISALSTNNYNKPQSGTRCPRLISAEDWNSLFVASLSSSFFFPTAGSRRSVASLATGCDGGGWGRGGSGDDGRDHKKSLTGLKHFGSTN